MCIRSILGIRDNRLELDIISCTIINFLLYIPSFFRKATGAVERQDNSVLPGGQIEIRHKCCKSSPEHGLSPFMTIDDFLNVKQVCEPNFIEFNNKIDRFVNADPGIRSKNPLLRTTRFPHINRDEGLISDEDVHQANKLASHFGITCGWDWHRKERTEFWQPVVPSESCDFHSVYDYKGNLSFQFIVVQDINGYAILPITIFRNDSYQYPLITHVPPPPPYNFFNEHELKNYPNAPVFLTDDIALAFDNPPSFDGIHLVNIGDNAWIEDLDFSLLRGREVTIMANDINISEYGIIRMLDRLNVQRVNPNIEQNPRLDTNFARGWEL